MSVSRSEANSWLKSVTLDELRQARVTEIERDRARLSLSKLADIFQLKKTTIRRLDLKPAPRGLSRREARYEQADVVAYLVVLNPDHREVWPHKLGRFNKPEEVGWMLSTAGRRVTPQTLAKWRFEGFGPIHIRVSSRTIRYRAEDVNSWVREMGWNE